MFSKLKWLALVLLIASLVAGVKSCSMFMAAAHLGSPAMHICRDIAAKSGQEEVRMSQACRSLDKHIFQLGHQYDMGIGALLLASLVLLLSSLFAWGLSRQFRRPPPNNSFKPDPLSGSA